MVLKKENLTLQDLESLAPHLIRERLSNITLSKAEFDRLSVVYFGLRDKIFQLLKDPKTILPELQNQYRELQTNDGRLRRTRDLCRSFIVNKTIPAIRKESFRQLEEAQKTLQNPETDTWVSYYGTM